MNDVPKRVAEALRSKSRYSVERAILYLLKTQLEQAKRQLLNDMYKAAGKNAGD